MRNEFIGTIEDLYAFQPPARPRIKIDQSRVDDNMLRSNKENLVGDYFPVRRVFCIGRNYAEHAVEMGHDPVREAPFFFEKTPYAITHRTEIPYPTKTEALHHELELYIGLGMGGRNISKKEALSHIFGAGIGLDLTRRDLQAEQKKMGRPWEVGKSFDYSAPVGMMRPLRYEQTSSPQTEQANQDLELNNIDLSLVVNDKVIQTGNTDQMIWKIPEIISILSEYYQLHAGDVIFTGTPAGVGPLTSGDILTAQASGFASLELRIV